jgi:predicted transposase/invertase (TIGR01784 family)
MPNFKKMEAELTTRLDKWLYFIKNLEDFQTIPTIFKDEIFKQAFEKAELAKFNQLELKSYETSLKCYRDLKVVIDTAFDEGKMEGIKEVAKALKVSGMSIEIIINSTGLTKNEIEQLGEYSEAKNEKKRH